ncbi:MAG: HAD family phosphatase [Erysipelotrichaceae bacterium]|nr:HAD family phosphatase [Erysipelotrichaceae bacterium]
MLKAILFDLDGTLVNSEDYYMKSMVKIAKSLGADAKESDFHICIGKDMDETYRIFEDFVKKPKDTWIKQYNDYFSKVDPINFKELLFDDVIDTLKGIKEKGIKVGICSMSPTSYIEKCVKECGFDEYVDYYISGETCKNNKPAPDIYLKALNDLNLKADEALVVEDATTGLLSAKTAGIKVVARDDSRFNVDQSLAFKVFKDLRKLLTII